jgi:hypothetical protein
VWCESRVLRECWMMRSICRLAMPYTARRVLLTYDSQVIHSAFVSSHVRLATKQQLTRKDSPRTDLKHSLLQPLLRLAHEPVRPENTMHRVCTPLTPSLSAGSPSKAPHHTNERTNKRHFAFEVLQTHLSCPNWNHIWRLLNGTPGVCIREAGISALVRTMQCRTESLRIEGWYLSVSSVLLRILGTSPYPCLRLVCDCGDERLGPGGSGTP